MLSKSTYIELLKRYVREYDECYNNGISETLTRTLLNKILYHTRKHFPPNYFEIHFSDHSHEIEHDKVYRYFKVLLRKEKIKNLKYENN